MEKTAESQKLKKVRISWVPQRQNYGTVVECHLVDEQYQMRVNKDTRNPTWKNLTE